MKTYQHVPLDFRRVPPEEQLRNSREFLNRMASRRTVRIFSSEPVAFELVENAIRCASLAPSGANQQPWKFVVVRDPEIKRGIREGQSARFIHGLRTGRFISVRLRLFPVFAGTG